MSNQPETDDTVITPALHAPRKRAWRAWTIPTRS